MNPLFTNDRIGSSAVSRRVFVGAVTMATIGMTADALFGARTAALAATTERGVVEIQGEFVLGPDSDGIDPTTQPVTLRLFVPPGDLVYPCGADVMPVAGFVRKRNGWAISGEEKARTGLEKFEIQRADRSGRFAFTLVDRRTTLDIRDYGEVWVELTIGDDAGETEETLVERHGIWSLEEHHAIRSDS